MAVPVAPPAVPLGSLRRTVLAGLALVCALAGAQVFAVSRAGGDVTDLWPPALLASCLPPGLGVLLHRRRAQRWGCLLGAVLTGLVALVLLPYGYGTYQIPAVVALSLAARRD